MATTGVSGVRAEHCDGMGMQFPLLGLGMVLELGGGVQKRRIGGGAAHSAPYIACRTAGDMVTGPGWHLHDTLPSRILPRYRYVAYASTLSAGAGHTLWRAAHAPSLRL